MTTQTCTCRSIPRERYLDPACPIHGDQEMARQASLPVEDLTDDELDAEFRSLFERLDPADKAAIRAELEVRSHE
ncbi:MAG: hypothetical protein RIE74_11040 [Pseudomonadales bacterium]